MRISDWSSDVCSSDLLTHSAGPKAEDVDPTIGDPIVPERNGRPTAPRLHPRLGARFQHRKNVVGDGLINVDPVRRSEEHTSELQSLMRISYAVFCLKKKKTKTKNYDTHN